MLFSIEILTSSSVKLCTKCTAKEAFMDSSFQTNGQTFEFYYIMASILKTSFLVVYLFLVPSELAAFQFKEEYFKCFLKSVKE